MFITQFNSPSISRDQGEEIVVNTNCDVFQLTPENTFYLRNKTWLKSADLKGCWVPTGTPSSFRKMPAAKNGSDVRANLPGKPTSASAVPEVFVSFEPAELIRLSGQPVFAPVAGTSLLWISNTESDLFRHKATGALCYSVATSVPKTINSITGMMIAWGCVVGGQGIRLTFGTAGSTLVDSSTHQLMALPDTTLTRHLRARCRCVWSMRRRRRLRGV